jgi:hypothetical protein
MVFGIKIPSLGKFTSRQALPWTLGGLAAGGALYFILTGRDTGIGPLDAGLEFVGDNTGLEGVFPNSAPATLKPAPGKTTVVHKSTGLNQFPFPVDQPFTPLLGSASYDPRHGAATGYGEQALHLQFSGAGELTSFSDDGRLTIA